MANKMKIVIGTFLIPLGICGLVLSTPIAGYGCLMWLGFGGKLTLQDIAILGSPIIFIILILYGKTLSKTDIESE